MLQPCCTELCSGSAEHSRDSKQLGAKTGSEAARRPHARVSQKALTFEKEKKSKSKAPGAGGRLLSWEENNTESQSTKGALVRGAVETLLAQLGKSSLLKDNRTEEVLSITFPLFLYAIILTAKRPLSNYFDSWSFVTGSAFGE